MLFAITKQRTEFVKLLMDYGCDLKQVPIIFSMKHECLALYFFLENPGFFKILI